LTKTITQSIIYLIFLEKARKEVVMELTRTPVGYVKDPEPLRGISPQATLISAKKPGNPLIEKCLERFEKKNLFGQSHVKRYLCSQYRRGCRPSTIRGTFQTIIGFITYLTSRGRIYLEQVTRNDLCSFVEHEQDRGLKPSSVSTTLRSVYAFLAYLVEREVVHPDVLRKKMYVKVPDTLPRAIDPEDIKRLLAVIKKPRDWAMILLLLRTGMRIGELLDTQVGDINLPERRIEIFEARKNRVGRVVYLSDDARRALRAWLKKRDPQIETLFYGQGRRKALSYEAARIMFHRYIQQAGLPHRGYTLHCLRHTFASELLNAGMRLECVQQLLGHSSIEMTRRYARLTDNTRKEEYFNAMAIIESGGINGHYQCHHQLSPVPEEKELLQPYHPELHEHAQKVCLVGGCPHRTGHP
jgi:integrase/recombinase XerD